MTKKRLQAPAHLGSSSPPAAAEKPLEASVADCPAAAEAAPTRRCRCALAAEQLLATLPEDSSSCRAVMAAPRYWRIAQLPCNTLSTSVRNRKGSGRGRA